MRTKLVGRDTALADARDRLRRHGLAVVTGASGIGKTALVDAVADAWRADGRSVVELRGTLGLRPIALAALTPLLPDGSGGSSPTEIAAAVADGLRQIPDDALLVVDDAHLLDDASAGLLAARVPSPRFAVVLAMTSGETAPPDLADLQTRLPDCVVELEPLGPGPVAEMATMILGHDLPAPDVEQLYRTTLGYPLYVSALLRETAAGSAWSTDRLAALLERRLGRLERAHRDLFDVLAFAEHLPADAVAAIDANGHAALDEANLLRTTAGRVAPAHPLLASVATASLTRDGRRRCAIVLLEQAVELDAADLVRITRSALSAGVAPEGDLLVAAAEAALAAHDHDTARSLAELDPDDPRLVAVRAEAQRFLGEVPDMPPPDLDEAALTDYLSQRAQALAFVEQRYRDATAVLADGLARVGTPALRTRLGLELLTLSGLSGDLEGVVHAARSIGDEADDDTRLLAAATRLFAEGLTLSLQDPEGTYELARRLVEAGAGDALLLDRLEMSRALTDLADGRLVDARHRFAGDRMALGPWLTIEALLADAWSPVAEAASVAAEAVAALEAFDPLGNLPQARGLLALRRAQQGLASDQAAPPESEPGVAAIQAVMDDRADAWLRRSPAALVDVGRRSVAMGHRLWGLCCFIDAVRLGARDDVAADIEQFAVAGGVGLARVAAIHARAATVDDHWAAARAWWAAGATSYATEAALAGAASDRDRAGLQLLATSATPTVGDWPPDGPWTDRQVGVVRRVLHGATNQAIADELFISRRTVENHLHAAYSAAGLDGREDLRDRFEWIAEPESEPTAGTAANRPGRPTMSTPTSANE